MNELTSLIRDHGAAVVFLSVLVEQLGLPIPAIPCLLVAGALAADGSLSVSNLFFAALLACLVADSAWYLAGRRYGGQVMKTLCRLSLTPDSCVSETHVRFERWGMNAILLSKFVPGLSVIAAPLAGATRIGWLPFLFFDGLGGILWIVAGLGAGMLFHQQIESLLAHLDDFGVIAGYVVAGLFAAYVVYKWWERHRFYTALRMARIDVHELYALMDAAAATPPTIFDVRSATALELEPRRIPGALHVSAPAIDLHIKDLPREREIILYCTCRNEVSAAQIAKLLIDRGYTRVRPLRGGLEAWITAGYKVETLETHSLAVAS